MASLTAQKSRPARGAAHSLIRAGALSAVLASGCARYTPESLLAGSDQPAGGARDRPEGPVLSVSGPPMEVRPVPVARVENHVPLPGPLTVGPEDVEGAVGSPEPTIAPPSPSGRAELVDAKVGDINGRPVYVSDFFDGGFGDRLAEKARERGIAERAWAEFAFEQIAREVAFIQRDELLEAEARASLEPQRRQGLRAFAREYGEKARRGRGGSRTRLERGLQESYNLSYEQFVRGLEADLLIRMQYERMIQSRVFITSRDITRYYERNNKVFNPDPVALFRQIRVSSDRPEDVLTVDEALARGDAFDAVARLPLNTSNREEGGQQRKAFAGEQAEAEFFGIPELNAAARTLEVGRWAKVPYGAWTSWLFLESISVVRRPLSDESVQIEIIDALSAQRENEVAETYLKRLTERASLGDVPRIRTRLLQIAYLRYWETR